MYLVNPLFIISNVVYIKPDSRYILIERGCWNTMVHLIFRGRKPSSEEFRRLKSLCYDVYVEWTDTGAIRYKEFHSVLASFQISFEAVTKSFRYFDETEQVDLGPSIGVELETYEETFFDTEFQYQDKTRELGLSENQSNFLISYERKKEHYEDEGRQVINYNIARSPQHKALVSFIGYGSIITMFRKLFSDGYLKFQNEFESSFLKFNSDYVYQLVSNRLEKSNLWFVCDECKGVNFHKYAKLTRAGDSFATQHSSLSVIKWFYKFDPLDPSLTFKPYDLLHISNRDDYPPIVKNQVRIVDYLEYDLTMLHPLFVYKSLNDKYSYLSCKIPIFMDLRLMITSLLVAEAVRDKYDNNNIVVLRRQCSKKLVARNLFFDRYYLEIVAQFFIPIGVGYTGICDLMQLDANCLDPQYDEYEKYFDGIANWDNYVDSGIAESSFLNNLRSANKFV